MSHLDWKEAEATARRLLFSPDYVPSPNWRKCTYRFRNRWIAASDLIDKLLDGSVVPTAEELE